MNWRRSIRVRTSRVLYLSLFLSVYNFGCLVSAASDIMERLPYNVKRWIGRCWWYPTVAFSLVRGYLFSTPWFHRVDDCILLGALPFESSVDDLYATENVRAVVRFSSVFLLIRCVHFSHLYVG
jgi:hypothetical protein